MAANLSRKYVIIGNGIAGTTCALTLRKNDISCEIWLITNEPYPLYNRVSLPRFLQGALVEQKVMMRDFAWHEQQRITLLTETTVTRWIPRRRWSTWTTAARCPTTRCWWRLAAGRISCRRPARRDWSISTTSSRWTTPKHLIARALESKTAVTSGGSFIAYELSEGFNVRGVHVTWLMRGPYWLRMILDPEGGRLVDEIATRHGVEVIHGEEIREVRSANGVPTESSPHRARSIQRT